MIHIVVYCCGHHHHHQFCYCCEFCCYFMKTRDVNIRHAHVNVDEHSLGHVTYDQAPSLHIKLEKKKAEAFP